MHGCAPNRLCVRDPEYVPQALRVRSNESFDSATRHTGNRVDIERQIHPFE